MWGEPEKALSLQTSDPLAALLMQITGPAHIPWQDPRWHELLHGYNIWVHVEQREGTIMEQACQSLIQHAPQSSNLAAFTRHVTRMLRELYTPNTSSQADDAVTEFSNRIAMVGKARVTAGSLNLFRILCHAVILQSSQDDNSYLEQCFLYKNRESSKEFDTAADLLDVLVSFHPPLNMVPELYDATTLALQLLLVLLSTQLYRPMLKTTEMFREMLLQKANQGIDADNTWTARSLLDSWLQWTLQRPLAPKRSITLHNCELAESVVKARGVETLGADGMYESHVVVHAAAPHGVESNLPLTETASSVTAANNAASSRRSSNVILDATKGVLVLSSQIILLPFRLMSLAFGLWGSNKEKGYDNAHRKQLASHLQQSNLTKDVLWLTDSPIADLASCLILLVSNNDRSGPNAFREELALLTDNRWEAEGEGLPDLPPLGALGESAEESAPLLTLPPAALAQSLSTRHDLLLVNFEALFDSFSRTTHNELGALLLYTMMMASKRFFDSIAVRSDLDRLVLPLLRTLYIASSLRHYAAQDYAGFASRRPMDDSPSSQVVSIRNCPFRSQSQLYVIIILLLLFSQDTSFGSDAFRRVMVTNLPWYKERNLKEANLGSVLVLCLLRSLTFNLNRFHDSFLLSNCCAILMNLSSSISDLHEYAAMRLAAVTISSMKRFANLRQEHPDLDEETEPSSLTSMHGEVSRTLLATLKHCLSSKNIERNSHLVYALVYHQVDFRKVVGAKDCPFRKSEIERIQQVITTASGVIEQGDARTAAKALKVLSEHMEAIRQAVAGRNLKRAADGDAFTFTYEEEADPESFFVPYVWEVIVCCATSSSIEWEKKKIQVFALLEHEATVPDDVMDDSAKHQLASTAAATYSNDVADVV